MKYIVWYAGADDVPKQVVPMKKSILFTFPDLSVGGSTTSFLSLLNEINYSRYDVDIVFLVEVPHEQLKQLPRQVRVLPKAEKFNLCSNFARVLKVVNGLFTGKLFNAGLACLKHRKSSSQYRIMIVNQMLAQINADFSRKIEKEYDVAIAFVELWATNYLVRKVTAKRKIAWIHVNYVAASLAIEMDEKTYEQTDSIVCVSDECVESFISVFPHGNGKTTAIENTVNVKRIRDLSNDVDIDSDFAGYKGFKIVTVCRIQIYTKGIDRIIRATKELKERGAEFKWYIVGDGNDMESCKKLAEKENVSDAVVFFGEKKNPYPYIKGADLFVLPSRHEGKPMVVTEAKILETPVIVTNYASAKSQINSGVDGVIISNDESSLAAAVMNLYDDREKLTEMKGTLGQETISNSDQMERFYALIEG